MNTTIINIINRAIQITKHDRTKNIDMFCQTHQTICLLSTLTWYFSPEGKNDTHLDENQLLYYITTSKAGMFQSRGTKTVMSGRDGTVERVRLVTLVNS